MSLRALVLNASFEPLCVVSSRRAAVLVLCEKAEVVHDTGLRYHAERLSVAVPSVVRLRTYVTVPFHRRVSVTRRAVMARDAHRCQYCGSRADSIDHVVPRSRGGAHTWDNVVAACRPCNVRKRDRMLPETSMRLRRHPRVPMGASWLIVSHGSVPGDWEPYLALGFLDHEAAAAV
jgi:5-methylcytosine-specific restriction endonuclease McrA